MQGDKPASDCALEADGATASRGCWPVWQWSMLIAVASLCQSVSMLSALVLHSITHSLIHPLIQLLTPSHKLQHPGQSISPISLRKYQHCPLLAGLICHLSRLMSHLKNDCAEQFLTFTLSRWFINLLWERRSTSFISFFFFIEEWWIKVEGWCTFGWPDLALSLTESLPPGACYWDTAISQVLWIRSETALVGEMRLDRSPGGRVIIRYDHWETTWVCVTAFVILTAEKKYRGEKRWLKECLPSLCLCRKKSGDTRVVS